MASQSWILKRRAPNDLAERLPGLDSILARVLHARKFGTLELAQGFLFPAPDAADPFLLSGMSEAVERILRALERRERIAVYGDYDADGVSATALLTLTLRALGADVTPYIPDRLEESYGLNAPAIKTLHEDGVRLIVTVDCGVRSVAEVAYAKTLGLDVVVTDHHSVPTVLPDATAVIDPKRHDSLYPFRELAGVGVAYRLAQALYAAAEDTGLATRDGALLEGLLDLVAVGTVADIVPLLGENRSLAQSGLERLREDPRLGLDALATVSGLRRESLNSIDIAFRLGPRLNAAGRLRNARLALDLLLAEDPAAARALAEELNQVNGERQRLLENQLALAQTKLDGQDTRALLLVYDPAFHEGIVGLIASRLSDEYYRPALVIHQGDEESRGSARSIEGVHITHALDECNDLLTRWGGHALAAGVTLPSSNLDALRERLTAYCAAHLDGADRDPKVHVDAIVTLDELSVETPDALAALEPFGEGNPEPALATRRLHLLSARAVGQEGKHLRMDVTDGRRTLPAIAFRMGDLVDRFRAGDVVDIVYRPTLNVWQGATSLQLVVQAIRTAS